MYVCVCNSISDQDLKKFLNGSCGTSSEVLNKMAVTFRCGCCEEMIQNMLDDAQVPDRACCQLNACPHEAMPEN